MKLESILKYHTIKSGKWVSIDGSAINTRKSNGLLTNLTPEGQYEPFKAAYYHYVGSGLYYTKLQCVDGDLHNVCPTNMKIEINGQANPRYVSKPLTYNGRGITQADKEALNVVYTDGGGRCHFNDTTLSLDMSEDAVTVTTKHGVSFRRGLYLPDPKRKKPFLTSILLGSWLVSVLDHHVM